MECKKCWEEHSVDLMYVFEETCVFCSHNTNQWNVKGEVVTRSDDERTTEEKKRVKARKKSKWNRL